MIDGMNTVSGGIWEMYDGSGAFLPVEAECLVTLRGVQVGYGARVAGSPLTDAAWEVNGWDTELGNHAPRRGAMYLQAGLTNRRGTMELPR